MSRHFAHLAFTPGVRAEQRRYNGQEAPVTAAGEIPELEDGERAFIAARNSFYLATVNSDGWPHVQHRGGATGFLKVLEPSLLAFADYGGNRQFVSVGNLMENSKAALILVDYPHRRRLKILGTIAVCPAAEADPAVLSAVSDPGAPVAERVMLVRVAAFDWNCSKFITPRYTLDELAERGFTS
ncbi:pyridoxamine 5'-phosphate oxidase family protein [Dechloromonas sp. XY25]|uniref:Pyridoxamine 5'-phosphate oxidase family protein n=1 Tax=Dechloromonas hankyongensis TaxID=2908002 RepID=A0ABS9K7B2_9RHOO|nr:pyridoxamine 5'-phosphate oxidase family protein [Dechloromonas hankyongensis]MCG2579064.1 pyridoxamine 5'-phosphate oxidase family protein [Dechloromonas hankyongensis]